MISLRMPLPAGPQRLTISPLLMVSLEARQIVTAITQNARPGVADWRQVCCCACRRMPRQPQQGIGQAGLLGSFSQLAYFCGGMRPEAIYSGPNGIE